MRRVAFYGGSFDPPHAGHQATVLYTLEHADVEKVIVAPVYNHPDGKALLHFAHRCSLVYLMLAPFSSIAVQWSPVEKVVAATDPRGWTVNTLKYLLSLPNYKDTQIVLVLGSDIKPKLAYWDGYDELKAMIDAGQVELFWVHRVKGLSSTNVRYRIRAGKDISRLVPRSICQVIKDNGWYKDP